MTPAPGDRLRRFVGDRVSFVLKDDEARTLPSGWCARLRTNLGRAEVLRQEILHAHTRGLPLAGESWRDLPMPAQGNGWTLELPLTEVGFFKAKAYLIDQRGWQHWPAGADVGISVHPAAYRTGNLIYCAFPRMFGQMNAPAQLSGDLPERQLAALDQQSYTVIPPSGKLRDLTRQLPHIFETLGCRILHLLPLNPTPTTYARFGRFGSPYAALDLKAIDPALVVFDRRTSGVDQFRELTYAAHLSSGRVLLDLAINHTGWGSVLQENHPEWFVRQPDGTFVSPGAWGITWEDLVELKHQNVALWDELAEVFLTWCRRGVDGFRCDAGYKVPVAAWQYILARVQEEYPETLFLLEGLGGAWEATEALLTEGGFQWAYSELFQNYSGTEVANYLAHSFRQGQRVGLLVHYSETHDNDRLAKRGRTWSLLRNRLCALASVSGGFGFTCGVEWLAAEKIKVHGNSSLAWGAEPNLVPELAKLNELVANHPSFYDGAKCTPLSPPDSPVYALLRQSEEGKDAVLILINTDAERPQSLILEGRLAGQVSVSSSLTDPEHKPETGKLPVLQSLEPIPSLSSTSPNVGDAARLSPFSVLNGWSDLLGQSMPEVEGQGPRLLFKLQPGAAYCLSPSAIPVGLHGEDYRRARLQAGWALAALAQVLPTQEIPSYPWRKLARLVDESPFRFLAALPALAVETQRAGRSFPAFAESLQPLAALANSAGNVFPCVIIWTLADARRVTLIPPGHWLLLRDKAPFRATLKLKDRNLVQNVQSIPDRAGHFACFAPRQWSEVARLDLERYATDGQHTQAAIRFLSAEPEVSRLPIKVALGGLPASNRHAGPQVDDLVLLTNGRGGMARLRVDLGRILSKYDCVLGANLHPTLPVDRHILAKRIRVWVNADGFICPLDFRSLAAFDPGPPAVWNFVANAGDARTVEIQTTAQMVQGRNTTVFHFSRPSASEAQGKQLPADADVRLTVRVDIEDRNFHWETKRNGGAEYHFASHLHSLSEPDLSARAATRQQSEPPLSQNAGARVKVGFGFTPAPERQLRVFSDAGWYHPEPEWSENIPHPIEQSRGQAGSGDAFSPGWFELPLPKGARVTLVVTAEPGNPETEEVSDQGSPLTNSVTLRNVDQDAFPQKLLEAARAFVVRRGAGKTVIAGYPWFLDWGRDTFICARGLLAAGLVEDVKQILITFAGLEQNGTLPNTIFGEDASNRDTSDAPLWFGLACEETAAMAGQSFYERPVGSGKRTMADVLSSIAIHYSQGTPNGIRMDAGSALIWSPAHFTWMDTNFPASSPREGYPIEIQALWLRLLRQLQTIQPATAGKPWTELATKALDSLKRFFWIPAKGHYADVLLAKAGTQPSEAIIDDALRTNCLLSVSLGLVGGHQAKDCVESARRHLLVPGALRSLAPLPVSVPLPIYDPNGRLLNDPVQPYWGRYEGDEDTRRKPAYHNGTAWTWILPVFCEALVRAWDFCPEAVAAAKAYLGSIASLMNEGCLGQIPEILDGDAPHTARGCDAQAWSVTETLRVWRLLAGLP